jgi:Family of unknown function (DUF6174)
MMRALMVLAALLVAPSAAQATPQSDLDAAKAKWADQGFANYRVTVQVGCFCPQEYTRPYLVHVRDGKPVQPSKYIKRYASVPRLFATIQSAIDGEGDLSVSYGARGVPTQIGLDPIPEAVDDESSISVSKLAEENASPPQVTDPSIQDGSALRELEAAEQRWRELGLTDYGYRLQRFCFCAPQTRKQQKVRVRDGKAVRNGPRVEGLFKTVRRAIRDRAAVLDVRYAKSGLPRRISYDISFMIADEELTLLASNLRALK